jgi:hypothetical protein
MSDTTEMPAGGNRRRPGPGRTPGTGKPARKHIPLPNGDYLEARTEFAVDTLGITDRTAQKMGLPTTYIGGIAHVPHNEALAIVAKRIRRPHQQQAKRPGPR